jgi:predicted RND superfamily exporter protein
MPLPVLIIGIPLISSLLWTFGITYFVLGMLNTMTSVLFVILFGLGIDYGIHYYARYIELRSEGKSIEEAILATHQTTGEAIVVSALTTAAALFVLVIAEFRGFSEFGFISGMGILFALLAMLYLIPAILVILERYKLILFSSNNQEYQVSNRPFPFYRSFVVIGLLISGAVLFNADSLRFQYDFGSLEPRFPKYEAFSKLAGQVDSGTKRNPAYIVAESDEQVSELVQLLRQRAEEDSLSPTIASIEALQERFPLDSVSIGKKLEKIAYIRSLLDDPLLKNQDSEDFSRLRRASQTTKPLRIDQIPDYLQAQFVSKDGEVGRFVIVYPSVGLSDGRKSIAFKDDVSEIVLSSGETKFAGSTSIVAAAMLDLMRTESPYMVGATFVMVFLFMLFTFRSVKWSIIAMLPLMVGLLFLFGIMILTGFQFNFYNLVVLPAILGIGEDSGVHLAYRYREEGKGRLSVVLRSTGQHITMGSLTTMLGFAGLLFTAHPGLQSLGIMAVLGIGMTLLTSLTFLPALLQWLESKQWI